MWPNRGGEMKRIYVHHDMWEDAKSGMYDLPSSTDDVYQVFMSANLLSSAHDFYNASKEMISSWRISALVNLSNRGRNRQAWLGQATCCYCFGAKEHQVKEAWHTLSEKQQTTANTVADEVIGIWEAYNA
jgi:hypothetical protein